MGQIFVHYAAIVLTKTVGHLLRLAKILIPVSCPFHLGLPQTHTFFLCGLLQAVANEARRYLVAHIQELSEVFPAVDPYLRPKSKNLVKQHTEKAFWHCL